MIVTDLDIVGIAIHEPEAYPALIVHGDRMLPFSFTLQRMQAVARRASQVLQPRREINVLELSRRALGYVRRKLPRLAGRVQLLCAAIGKCLDHVEDCNVSRDNSQNRDSDLKQ